MIKAAPDSPDGCNESAVRGVSAESTVPSGWLDVDLASLFTSPNDDIVDGPFGSNLKAAEYVDHGVPIARLQNIDRNRFVEKNIKYVTPEKTAEISRHTFLPDDILITKLGDPLGKACIAPASIKLGVLVADVVRARIAHEWVDRKFLCYQINSEQIAGQFKDETKGTTRPRVNLTKIRSLRVKLCPHAEQVRIVEKLEELFSDLDAGIAELRAAQKKLVQYRQSLLKAAVDGTLTASWREAQSQQPDELRETGAQLLRRILTERRGYWEAKQLAKYVEQDKPPPTGWKGKYIEPFAPNADGLPALPLGWLWVSLDQILCDLRSGTAETSGRDVTSHPVLKSSAVRQARIDFEALNYLREDQSQRRDNYLMPGDVLITRLSGSVEYVGCCAVVGDLPVARVQYPDRIFCGKLSPSLMWLGHYLVCCFRSPYVRERLEAAAKSTAGHKRISLSDLYPLPIPLPPAAEIREILMQTSDALQRADDADYAVEIGIKQSAAQRQNILKAAFSGQLVPQDPSDEPAAVLLERIRAERAVAGTGSGKRGRKTRALS